MGYVYSNAQLQSRSTWKESHSNRQVVSIITNLQQLRMHFHTGKGSVCKRVDMPSLWNTAQSWWKRSHQYQKWSGQNILHTISNNKNWKNRWNNGDSLKHTVVRMQDTTENYSTMERQEGYYPGVRIANSLVTQKSSKGEVLRSSVTCSRVVHKGQRMS